MSTYADIVRDALAHVLQRAGTDPDFHYHMAWTESLKRLCDAYASVTGEDGERLYREITEGKHLRGVAREQTLREQIERVERLLDAREVRVEDLRTALRGES